jgi:hypothetical protein
MKLFVCTAVVLVLSFLLSIGVYGFDEYPRNEAFDAIHYRLHRTLKDASDEITGETEILFKIKQSGVRSIALDLVGLVVDGASEEKRPQHSPTRTGSSRSRSAASTNLGIAAGSRSNIGRPSDGLLRKNKFSDFAVFADNWPNRARFWFPSIDHP